MTAARPTLAVLALLLCPPAFAQPAGRQAAPAAGPARAAPAVDEARVQAAAVLALLNPSMLADRIIDAQRRVTVGGLQGVGQTASQAGEVFDTYILPELRARRPELITRFEDVLIADYTLPELRALAARRDGPDWRAAQTKIDALPAHLDEAARAWAAQVGPDAFQKNKAELAKLGVVVTGGPK